MPARSREVKCTPDVRPCRNNTGTRPLGCTSPWGLLVHLVPSLSLDALVSLLPPARAYRPAVASGPPFGAALCPLNAPAWTSRGAVHGVLVVPPRRPTTYVADARSRAVASIAPPAGAPRPPRTGGAARGARGERPASRRRPIGAGHHAGAGTGRPSELGPASDAIVLLSRAGGAAVSTCRRGRCCFGRGVGR